jgi:hypothetical protein
MEYKFEYVECKFCNGYGFIKIEKFDDLYEYYKECNGSIKVIKENDIRENNKK